MASDDSEHAATELEILRDVGRWRREQEEVAAAEVGLLADPSARLLSGADRERILAGLMTTENFSVLEPEGMSDSHTVPSTAGNTTSHEPVSKRRALPWRGVASYLLAGAAGVGVTAAVWAASVPGQPAFESVVIVDASDPTASIPSGATVCPKQPLHVRIDPVEGQSLDRADDLEVLISAKPKQGSTYWITYHADTEPWMQLSDGALSFVGPLRTLAPVTPGDWSLRFYIGPRGACGPSMRPSCRELLGPTFRVAAPDECQHR